MGFSNFKLSKLNFSNYTHVEDLGPMFSQYITWVLQFYLFQKVIEMMHFYKSKSIQRGAVLSDPYI